MTDDEVLEMLQAAQRSFKLVEPAYTRATRARDVAAFRARQAGWSYMAIARVFEHRTHGNVRRMVRRIQGENVHVYDEARRKRQRQERKGERA